MGLLMIAVALLALGTFVFAASTSKRVVAAEKNFDVALEYTHGRLKILETKLKDAEARLQRGPVAKVTAKK